MRTIQQLDTVQSKQRQRIEISNHVEDFLHKGGRIEVVAEPSLCNNSARPGHRPAAAELALISNLLDE